MTATPRRPKPYRIVICACCGQSGKLVGRGLINTCYKRHKYHGTLTHYPRVTTPRDIVLDRWHTLASRVHGWTFAQLAAELRIKPATLQQALVRARRRGDSRAVYHRL